MKELTDIIVDALFKADPVDVVRSRETKTDETFKAGSGNKRPDLIKKYRHGNRGRWIQLTKQRRRNEDCRFANANKVQLCK